MKIINACIPLIKTNQYKGILCSTYRTFPLTAAKTLAIHTNLPFVVDLRDIIEQYASNEYISHKFHTFSWLDAFITKRFRKRLLRKRNNALEVADCVTTVSPWHVEVLKQYNPNVKLIYNGFPVYHYLYRTVVKFSDPKSGVIICGHRPSYGGQGHYPRNFSSCMVYRSRVPLHHPPRGRTTWGAIFHGLP